MGSSNIRTKNTYMHTYIVFYRDTIKVICDRIITRAPSFLLAHVLSFETHFLTTLKYTKSKENVVKVKHRVQIPASALLIVNEGRKQT